MCGKDNVIIILATRKSPWKSSTPPDPPLRHVIPKVHNTQHYYSRAVPHTDKVSHGVPCPRHAYSPPSYPRSLQWGLLIRLILSDSHPAPSLNATSPHSRPKTPSHMPVPSQSHFRGMSETQWDDGAEPTISLIQHAPLPDHSPPLATTHGGI